MPFVVGRLWKTLLISGPASAEGVQPPCSSLMLHGHVKKAQYNGLLDIKGISPKTTFSVEISSTKSFPNIIYIAWHTFLIKNILYASLLPVYLQRNVRSPVSSLSLWSSNHPARHNILSQCQDQPKYWEMDDVRIRENCHRCCRGPPMW